ncbi:hypothetical protein NFJ02_26g60950 [Pycnococcus provasolii]
MLRWASHLAVAWSSGSHHADWLRVHRTVVEAMPLYARKERMSRSDSLLQARRWAGIPVRVAGLAAFLRASHWRAIVPNLPNLAMPANAHDVRFYPVQPAGGRLGSIPACSSPQVAGLAAFLRASHWRAIVPNLPNLAMPANAHDVRFYPVQPQVEAGSIPACSSPQVAGLAAFLRASHWRAIVPNLPNLAMPANAHDVRFDQASIRRDH